MNLIESVKTCFKKYGVIEGRASRSEYWFFILFYALVSIPLELFAYEKFLSPSITAIKTGEIDAEEFRKTIKNKFDILLAGGQDQLKGKIFRVGHLGYVNDRDIITVITVISNTLLDLGKITAQQAGEALGVVSKYLEEN